MCTLLGGDYEGGTVLTKRKGIGGLLSLALLAVVVLATMCESAVMADEFRGFWVDAWGAGFLSQSQVDTLLGVPGNANSKGQIRDANCNAIVMQVRRNCDANYPSAMGEPYMSGLSPSNFNALQAVINAAHDTTGGKKRIEVHCWMVAFRTSGGAVYSAHSGTPTGSLTSLDNYWPSRDSAGAEVGDKAFDPGHPLAEEYNVNVAMDLVTRFDIDGIHYDYIRFTANNQGYNPTSIARYNARYGLTGQPASTNEQFKQWRRDQISAFVRKVYAKVQAVKPWVKQSAAGVTWNPSPTTTTRAGFQATRPYYDVYSDWDSWQQEGIVDANIPMTYYNWASLPNDYTKWMNFEKDRKANRHIYIGPGIYLNSLANSILELQKTRDASPAGNYAQGWCGYSYRVPYASGTWAGFSPSLVSAVTPTETNVPAMPWKTAPTKGHISGTVTYFTGGAWVDGATIAITGPESRSMLSDGTGFYAFIDLTPGVYTVTASKSGYPDTVKTVTVAIGSVTGNMYLNDMKLGGTPAPTITNVAATGIATTSANISWTTDQAASSQVQYGLTASYGSSTALDSGLVTSHSQALTGLTPGTVYHYRVISANVNGSTTSGDYTFTTLAPPVVSNVQAASVTATSATITWTTNQGASTQVHYGPTTSYGLSSTLNPSLVTSHSVALSGLASGTLYHYRVVSANANGSTTSGDFTFTTNGSVVISNVQTTNLLATSATITWTTNEAASSQVEYGTTTSYGSSTALDSNAVTSHSVALSGLTAGTTYHFRVKSTNAGGSSASDDSTFTTNSLAAITSVAGGSVTNAAATITWTTNQAADSQVEYGTTTSYGTSTTLNSSAVTSHSVALSGLAANTLYHYRVKSGNANGTSTSGDYTFTTLGPPIISDVTASGISTTTATITWTTNNASDSKVNYGTSTSYGSQGASSTAVTSHTVTLTGLTHGTTYHYQCVSVNTYGTATSTDYSFTTLVPATEIVVDNTDPGWTDTGSGSWNTGSNSAVPKIGGDYLYYAGQSSATRECTWTPALTTDGLYDVYAFYQKGTNRNPAATYTLHYYGGQLDSVQDQSSTVANQGDWFLIAENRPFLAGSTGYLELTNQSSSTLFVSADAARWVYKAPLDLVAPTISISAPSATATRGGPITYTISYSDDNAISAITLANANVTLNHAGIANGTVTVSGTGTSTRTVTISGTTGNGTLGISIAAGTASDVAGNLAAAAGPSATFAVDNVAPTVSIGTPSAALATSGPITYTINYSNANAVTLADADVSLNKTGTADGTVAVTGSGTATRAVSISNITGDGTLGISLAAGTASDNAGNTALAPGASETFAVDNTVPTMTSVTDEIYTTSTTGLQGWWAASDAGSGIARCEYAVGTTSGGTELKGWTDAGTATSATATGLSLSVGDTYFISARAVDNAGLSSSPMSSAGVKVAQPVASIQQAKGLADGEVIALPARVVSATFADMFYIAQPNRISGIRVASSEGVSVGQSVIVLGVLGLASGCERAILSPKVIPGDAGTAIKPVTMIGRSIGGGGFEPLTPGITDGVGLNNIGMLVRIAGGVTTINPDGFVVDDGSKVKDSDGDVGIKVWTGTSAGGSPNVIVTGVVSCETVGGKVYPVILATEVTSL